MTKTLLLEMANNTAKRLDIPDDATFTFGGMSPAHKYPDAQGGWTIRVKVGKDQIAVIVGVKNAWIADQVTVYQTISSTGEELAEPDPFSNLAMTKLTPDAWEDEHPF